MLRIYYYIINQSTLDPHEIATLLDLEEQLSRATTEVEIMVQEAEQDEHVLLSLWQQELQVHKFWMYNLTLFWKLKTFWIVVGCVATGTYLVILE